MVRQDEDFAALPWSDTAEGRPRRTGVEIELGGLHEERVAAILAAELGGKAAPDDGQDWRVTGSRLGDLQIYLDTALRKGRQSALRDAGLELGREVIPLEIVTEPLDRDGLRALDRMRDILRREGATGSRAGLLLGFGVHLNVETPATRHIVPTLLAYALVEDWLRIGVEIDESRRVLPFTDPYPHSFTRELIDLGTEAELAQVAALYAERTPTRNRGLDMLPVFKALVPEVLPQALAEGIKGRPAYHFRLPDCRIDEPGWSLDHEWRRWLAVERVAADPEALEALSVAWRDRHGPLTVRRHGWSDAAGEILGRRGLTAGLQ